MSKTGELTATVPSGLTLEEQIAQFRRWLEGHVKPDGTRDPGLIEMVGELYTELKTRRERREVFGRAFGQAVASGSVLAAIGLLLNYWFGHK